jgi:hypothetical protein
MAEWGDPPTIYRTKMQRAKKVRRCDECGRTIGEGEHYKYAFCVYEGHGEQYAMCQHCAVAARWLVNNCGGFLHHGVWEDFEEHINEYPRMAFSLLRLSVARRRRWERFDRTGLMDVPALPPSFVEVGLGE